MNHPHDDLEQPEGEYEPELEESEPENDHPRGCGCWDCAYERAAARARGNDFEDTDGKDWT